LRSCLCVFAALVSVHKRILTNNEYKFIKLRAQACRRHHRRAPPPRRAAGRSSTPCPRRATARLRSAVVRASTPHHALNVSGRILSGRLNDAKTKPPLLLPPIDLRDGHKRHWLSQVSRFFFRTCPTQNSEHECTADDGRAREPSAQRVRARRELRSEPLAAAQRAPEPRFVHA